MNVPLGNHYDFQWNEWVFGIDDNFLQGHFATPGLKYVKNFHVKVPFLSTVKVVDKNTSTTYVRTFLSLGSIL